MRRLIGTPLRIGAVALAIALALVLLGGMLGRAPEAPQIAAEPAAVTPVDRLEQMIQRSQERLRRVPGDWHTWASLGMAYLERARITADPLALASALRKIEAYSRGTPPATTNPSTAHLFISNPFKGGGAGVTKLFSTHPSTAERVERLEHMAYGTPQA